jgi:Lrp/AsnC family leucine-responsive transcriptional regulator
VLKVAARSMPHLEETVGAISGLGGVSTSIVYSTTFTGRIIEG